MTTCFPAAAWGAVGSRCKVGRRLTRVDLLAKIVTEALRECKALLGYRDHGGNGENAVAALVRKGCAKGWRKGARSCPKVRIAKKNPYTSGAIWPDRIGVKGETRHNPRGKKCVMS